jgi:hypothetical protein
MSMGMSALMSHALRRTPVLSRQLLSLEDALDLEKTAVRGRRGRHEDHQ